MQADDLVSGVVTKSILPFSGQDDRRRPASIATNECPCADPRPKCVSSSSGMASWAGILGVLAVGLVDLIHKPKCCFALCLVERFECRYRGQQLYGIGHSVNELMNRFLNPLTVFVGLFFGHDGTLVREAEAPKIVTKRIQLSTVRQASRGCYCSFEADDGCFVPFVIFA